MEWEKDGSLRIALDINSKSKKTLHDLIVSKFPFYINSINRLETAGDGGGLHTEFNHLLPTGEWGSISIANSKLYSPTGNQTLSGYGLLTNDWQNFRKAVVHMTHQIKEEGVQYSHWGWKDDHKSFLIGNRLYTNGAIKVVPVNATMLKRGRGLKPATGGSLGAWQRDANKMFGPGLEPMGIVLMASFAAPLMSLAWREGGVLIYLVAESAKGKTLALEMGASVWGEYDSLRLISDDTRISKSILMGTVCHLPVLHDELTQGEPKYFEQWMKTFSEGKDKARATGDGTVHETDFHWSTNLIGAGNQSCKDLLSDQGDTADAMSWRIVELFFDTSKVYTMTEMEAIRDRMVANAGWAGDDYLRYLVTPGVVESVKARMREKVETLITKYGFEQKHRFYLRFLSCLWSAGEIIEKLQLLEIDTNRQVDWVAQKMVEQIRPPKLKEPSIYDVAIDSTATKILIDFLNENNEYKLIVKSSKEGLSQGMPIMEPRGKAVYVRHEMADKIMYLYDKWFAKWLISKRYSVQSVLKELIKLGVMDPLKKAKNLGAGTVWDFNGRVDCYVVRLVKFSKLTEEDEAGKIIPLERIKRK